MKKITGTLIALMYCGVILYIAFYNVNPVQDTVVYGQIVSIHEESFIIKDIDHTDREIEVFTSGNTLLKESGSKRLLKYSYLKEGLIVVITFEDFIGDEKPYYGMANIVDVID